MLCRKVWWVAALLLACEVPPGTRGVARLRVDLAQIVQAQASADSLFIKAKCTSGSKLALGPLPLFSEALIDLPACGPADLELVIGSANLPSYLSTTTVDLVDGQVVDVTFAAYPAGAVIASVSDAVGPCALELDSRRPDADAPRVRRASLQPGVDTSFTALAGLHDVHCFDAGGIDRLPETTFVVVRGVSNSLHLDAPPVVAQTRPPDGGRSTVTADRSSGLAPDGIDGALVTVEVRDVDGVALPGVTLQLVLPSFTTATPAATAVSDGAGQAQFVVHSTQPGVREVSVEALFQGSTIALGAPLQLSFVDGSGIAIDVEGTGIVPFTEVLVGDGVDTATVLIETYAAGSGDPIVGARVDLVLDPPLLPSTAQLFTGLDGTATLVVTSQVISGAPQAVQVAATVNATSVPPRLLSVEPRVVSTRNSSVVSSRSYGPADGSSAKVTLTLRDQKGRGFANEPLDASGVPSQFAGTPPAFPTTTDGTGVAELSYGSPEAVLQRFDFSATVNSVTTTLRGFLGFAPAIRPVGFDAVDPARVASADASQRPRISADGAFVVFVSDAALVPQDTNGQRDVYRYCLYAASCPSVSRLQLVSADAGGAAGNGQSIQPDISGDGRFVVFTSKATNLGDLGGPIDGNTNDDIYVRDMTSNLVLLLSVDESTNHAAGSCSNPAISADGTAIVFESRAGSALFGSANAVAQVVRSLPEYATTPSTRASVHLTLVSADGTGNPGNGESTHPAVAVLGSGDSRIVFETVANNLVVPLSARNIARADLSPVDGSTPVTVLVSRDSGANPGDFVSSTPEITPDGEWIVFVSSDNLVAASDGNGPLDDIYLWGPSSISPTMQRLVSCANLPTGQGCAAPRVSGDARFVVFDTLSPDLAGKQLDGSTADADLVSDVFVFDTHNQQTRRLSERFDRSEGTGVALAGDISVDGRNTVLLSSTPLTAHPLAAANAVYMAPNPTLGGSTTLASSLGDRVTADADSGEMATLDPPSLSDDGRYAVFSSTATLDPDFGTYQLCPSLRCIDVFAADLLAGTVKLLSRSISAGSSSFGDARHPQISRDGRFVVFDSDASDLPAGVFVSSGRHVYRYDLVTNDIAVVDLNTTGVLSTGAARNPVLSSDGRFVAFESNTEHGWFLGNSDVTTSDEIYRRDMNQVPGQAKVIELVSATPASYLGQAQAPSISADGDLVAYESLSAQLLGDTNSGVDVYVRRMSNQQLELASRSDAGTSGDGDATHPMLSGDGSYVVFDSTSTNLVTGFASTGLHVPYVRKLNAAQNAIEVASRKADGSAFEPVASCATTTSTGVFERPHCSSPSISFDGRYISFMSDSAAVVPAQGAVSSVFRAYLWDRVTNGVDYAQGWGPIVTGPSAFPDTGEVTSSPNFMARVTGDGRHVGLIHIGADYGYFNQQLSGKAEIMRVTSPFQSSEVGGPAGGSFGG